MLFTLFDSKPTVEVQWQNYKKCVSPKTNQPNYTTLSYGPRCSKTFVIEAHHEHCHGLNGYLHLTATISNRLFI